MGVCTRLSPGLNVPLRWGTLLFITLFLAAGVAELGFLGMVARPGLAELICNVGMHGVIEG